MSSSLEKCVDGLASLESCLDDLHTTLFHVRSRLVDAECEVDDIQSIVSGLEPSGEDEECSHLECPDCPYCGRMMDHAVECDGCARWFCEDCVDWDHMPGVFCELCMFSLQTFRVDTSVFPSNLGGVSS